LIDVPRFSVSEFSTLNRSYDEDLAAFAAGGAEGIGIAEVKLPAADDAESIRKLRASGLKATVCLPATLSILPNALGPEPAEPEARVQSLAGSVRRLARFEPKVVLFLTGAAGERDAGEARRLVVEGVRELGRVGREVGVTVALEPIHRSAEDEFTIVTDLPGTEELLAEAGDPSVGILFDTWHLWDTPDVLDHARRLAHRFPAVHVNDRRAHTRDWDDRALPGDGVIDLPAILGALEAGGFNGWYELEVLSSESYPDSLLLLDPSELVRRGRAGFVRAWEARTRY
jgi:sugar phosphate isomerase/epimerase